MSGRNERKYNEKSAESERSIGLEMCVNKTTLSTKKRNDDDEEEENEISWAKVDW